MAYISPQRVKEIRNQLKKEFPNFKLSVVTENHSTVSVSIMEGPLDFGTTYSSINPYYIEDNHKGEVKDLLLKIKEIINAGNYTVNEDSDYGSIPKFYIDINIGKWDKHYKIIKNA